MTPQKNRIWELDGHEHGQGIHGQAVLEYFGILRIFEKIKINSMGIVGMGKIQYRSGLSALPDSLDDERLVIRSLFPGCQLLIDFSFQHGWNLLSCPSYLIKQYFSREIGCT